MKIIIPHEGVNEIPEGYKPLITTDGKLMLITQGDITKNDVYWLESKRCISVINWEQRRYELAKDISCAYLQAHTNVPFLEIAKVSVKFADELITQLKEIPTINSD